MESIKEREIKIDIDFDFCQDGYPCKHKVVIREDDKILLSTIMRAPEIVELIINNNLKTQYHELDHFRYCFKYGYQHEYLKRIKESV